METKNNKTTAYLIQIFGEHVSKKFQLVIPEIKIGRSLFAEIKLQSPVISRNHCTINYIDSEWAITDNNSQHGTYISGRQLKPYETRRLQCDDIIRLGPISDVFEAFCFKDTFVNDECISNARSEDEIMELPPLKRAAEEKMTDIKKQKFEIENADIGCIENEQVKEIANASLYKHVLYSPKSKDTESQTSRRILHNVMLSTVDPPKSSVNSVDLKENENIESCCSLSSEVRGSLRPLQSSQPQIISDIVTLLSKQTKLLEKSELDLQKSYEILLERNFSFDPQLKENKECLKICALKVKFKNEQSEKLKKI